MVVLLSTTMVLCSRCAFPTRSPMIGATIVTEEFDEEDEDDIDFDDDDLEDDEDDMLGHYLAEKSDSSTHFSYSLSFTTMKAHSQNCYWQVLCFAYYLLLDLNYISL